MSSIITSSSVAKDSYYQEEYDKENVVPEIVRKVSSAATRSITWSEQLEYVVEIETKTELIDDAENPLWHEMDSLGIEAMLQRNDPDELREYQDSYLMLQDLSVDGFVCDLYNPEKYLISYSTVQEVDNNLERKAATDGSFLQNNPELVAMISGLDDEQLAFLIGRMQGIMESRGISASEMKHNFKPIGF